MFHLTIDPSHEATTRIGEGQNEKRRNQNQKRRSRNEKCRTRGFPIVEFVFPSWKQKYGYHYGVSMEDSRFGVKASIFIDLEL